MSRLDLPRSMRDPGFQRRLDQLDRCATKAERDEVLSVPLVADRRHDPEAQTECPKGHVAQHPAEPHNYAGMTFMACRCERCGSGWWEALS